LDYEQWLAATLRDLRVQSAKLELDKERFLRR